MKRSPRQALAGQLRRFADEAKRYELRARRDGKDRLVDSWENWDDVDDVASAAIDASEDDGADDDYTVVSLDSDGEELGSSVTWHGESRTIVVNPKTIEAPLAQYDDDREPAQHMVRFMGRLMTHSEAQNRIALQHSKAVAKDNKSMRDHIRSLEKAHRDILVMHEQLISEQEERDQKRREKREQMQLAKELVQDIKPLFPVVVNKLLGRQMLNEDEQTTLGSLLGSLDNRQIAIIQSALKPGQLVALQNLIDAADREEPDNGQSH
jgi:hypothetical protein